MADEVPAAKRGDPEVDEDHDPAVRVEDALFLDIFHVSLL
jgi:hypothetical protein